MNNTPYDDQAGFSYMDEEHPLVQRVESYNPLGFKIMTDKDRFATHTLWSRDEPGAPEVTLHGLMVCKQCGAGESELYDETCLERLLKQAIEAEKKLTPLQRAINSLYQKLGYIAAESTVNLNDESNGTTIEGNKQRLRETFPEFIVLTELERFLKLERGQPAERSAEVQAWLEPTVTDDFYYAAHFIVGSQRYVGTDEGAIRALAHEFKLARERGVEPDRAEPGADNTVRKAHYGDGRQPIDDILAAGWGPHFAAANVLKYLRRDKDHAGSVDKARWYYNWIVQYAAGEINGPFTKTLEALEDLLTQHERLIVRDIKEKTR